MPVDYEALRGSAGTSGVPDNGPHTARLERAKLWEGDKGSSLITEWSNEKNVMWTSWNRFDMNGLSYTQELLDGLGIDRSKITDDDALEAALNDAEGQMFLIRTDAKQGSQGDRWFINTYVDGRAVPEQSELPVDTEGLPALDGSSNGETSDGDVPF